MPGHGEVQDSPPAAAEEVALRLCRREGRSAVVLGLGLAVAAEPTQLVGAGGVERVVAVELELVDGGECCWWPVDLADGDPAPASAVAAVVWLDADGIVQRKDEAYAVRMLDLVRASPRTAIRAHDGTELM